MLEVFQKTRVMPVIEITDHEDAAPLAEALQSGGLGVFEFTLRTSAALDALVMAKKTCPDLVIGMGTVLTVDDANRALDAGADFLVTPGVTSLLLAFAAEASVPVLLGTATASDVMRVLDAGLDFMKFFPAEPAGGIAYLKALKGPLAKATFCPTGGINQDRVDDYLVLDNVICVGGSWVATRKKIADKDWVGITENARIAAIG